MRPKHRLSIEQTNKRHLLPHVQQFHILHPTENYNRDLLTPFLFTKDRGLARKPESQITTVLMARAAEKGEASEESDGAGEGGEVVVVQDLNTMNRSLLSVYAAQDIPAPSPTDVADKPLKKRTRTDPIDTQIAAEIQKKSRVKAQRWNQPKVKLEDLGGIEQCIEEVLQLIGMPLKHPEIYLHLGIQPPRGILLHGPPGCGKTLLAHAIAGECNVPFINISAPSIVSGMSGESEKKLREVFEEARELAPCILFIDEIDAITPKRETAQREMERRIVAQLLTCMDDLSLDKTNNKPVILIGATNRPDSLDPALRRAGRFDREISMAVPNQAARESILRKLASRLKLDGDFDFCELAKLTPGYNALTAEAGLIAVNRIFQTMHSVQSVREEMQDVTLNGVQEDTEMIDTHVVVDDSSPLREPEQQLTPPALPFSASPVSQFLSSHQDPLTPELLSPLHITMEDFLLAIEKVQPSSKREGFATVPGVTWDDIGALSSVREELRMAVVEPVKHPEYFTRVGINAPVGVLLYGPPGCGKTLLAKAVANESHCNFISVKGPELLNKYVGESERAIRQVFARAQSSSPCIIFFDELDALCPARSADSESQSSSRLVNTLLTEMDGMQNRNQVFVIAATNRPEIIDPAMLRPGRLDKCLYVDLPTPFERHEILKTVSRLSPLHTSVNLLQVAQDPRCDGFSGADLSALVREAGVSALRRGLVRKGDGIAFMVGVDEVWIKSDDFDGAFVRVRASVSGKNRRRYEGMRVKFGSSLIDAKDEKDE